MLLPATLAAVIGYFLGALPFGYLVARSFGINIFEHGSKNPGATNVKRVLGEKFGPRGKRAGTRVFLLDAVKGALAAGWPFWAVKLRLLPLDLPAPATAADHARAVAILAITGLVAALIGHSFSCFTRFRGGKGVATSAGGLFMLLPWPALIALATWGLVFRFSRYVSLASIVAAVVLPVAAWLWPWPHTPLPFALLATLIGAFVILRHRTNIKRLLSGTENRFARKT
ncbi:acyl-phosphate glycerol 3-phosphate acyltransferase [Opitutaceae bacterium TAV1]|nr:acyl-phosphate glycerol 3-phosphate acyltransferase [Opitutaceae bacterium TAV1]